MTGREKQASLCAAPILVTPLSEINAEAGLPKSVSRQKLILRRAHYNAATKDIRL